MYAVRYRVSGDPKWQEKGWGMFQSIVHATQTDVAFSAIAGKSSKIPFFHFSISFSFFFKENKNIAY